MKNVSLKLPDDLHAKLAQISKARGAAKSDVIRNASKPTSQPPKTANASRASI